MKTYTLKPLFPENANLPEDFDKDLNPAQREAVFFDQGPMLLIAGAGSGKTKTLVHRVARLVHSGVAPQSILLLTFTRKAAEEMLNRASKILDSRCQDVSGGTFHSFGNIILRQYAKHIGYNNQFTIMDRGDQEDLINLIRKEQKWAVNEKRFPKKSTIATVISKSINTGKSILAVLTSDFPQFLDFQEEITKIAIDYQSRKQIINVMDYDDLLTKLGDLLEQSEEVRTHLQNKFHYIMVDEYQDTNLIQARVISLLSGNRKNVMVVGDDSQSIYSFRGAHFKNIMSFPELFPGAKIIKLEQNYRSSQPILDLTNAVISHAKEKYPKTLFTTQNGGEKPTYIETENDNHQSRFICQKILELRENGRNLNDIAVLMRSGWHSNDLEVELKTHNIPFVKHGGFKFVESAHVKDVIAYLKLMANPTEAVSWHRVLMLIDGLGPKGIETVIANVKAQLTAGTPINADAFKAKTFGKDIEALFMLLFKPNQAQQKPSILLDQVMTYYKPVFKATYDNFNKRQSDLDSIISISQKYPSLEAMLSELTLEPPTLSQSDSVAEDSEDEVITLSTIHSAKGLEWDTVFLISAVDGYLPSFQSLGDLGQLEEERRLMYVALTRAKTNLFILKPNLDLSQSNYYRFSGIQFSKPSRFLEEFGVLENHTERMALEEDKPKYSFDYNPKTFQNYKARESQQLPKKQGWTWGAKRTTSGFSAPSKSYDEIEPQKELTEDDFSDINPENDRRRYYF